MSWGRKYDLAANLEQFFNQCHVEEGGNGGRFCETDGGSDGGGSLASKLAGPLKSSLGIPRSKMPQLGGVPVPGSKADHLKKDKSGEVDARSQFKKFLEDQGIDTKTKKVEASSLKPSQDDLDYAKVQRFLDANKEDEKTVFVSNDGYILDGHHHWAANEIKNSKLKVVQADVPIREFIDLAKRFDKEWGLHPKGING